MTSESAHETTICEIALWQTDYQEQMANSRLIAAAPNMLSALKSLIACYGGNDETRPVRALGDAMQAVHDATRPEDDDDRESEP